MTLTFLSVCSGIEAASVAWHPLGFRAVGFSEIEAFPSAVLAHQYGSNMPGEPLSKNGIPNHGDFTAINLDAIPKPLDVLVGGTPCQAFSIAGKRLSLADARGNLSLAFTVLAHELAGSHGLRNVVWENVDGVLSTEDNAFGCFLGALVGSDDALLPCPCPPDGRSNDLWRWRPAGRWPVLDDDGEETGEFVERPAMHIARWPRFGMASGPRGRLAWRVLDAQWFGLAQRRKRVFVVADLGGGADPVQVLFEPLGVRGNTPPSREAGKAVAGTLGARAEGGGGLGTDFELDGGLTAIGGGPSGGTVSSAINAKWAKGSSGPAGDEVGNMVAVSSADVAPPLTSNPYRDHESREGLMVACEVADSQTVGANQTTGFIGDVVAHSLRAEGYDASEDGTGRGTPIVPIYAIQERAVSENPNAGPGGSGIQEGISYTLEARHHVQAIAFPERMSGTAVAASFDRSPALGSSNPTAVAFAQNTRDEVRLFGADGQTVGALSAEPGGKQQCYIAQPAVAFDLRGRDGGAMPEGPHDTAAMRAASGGSSRSYVAQTWAVRRLTPVECERLQGFPDSYTAIPWRGKAAENCPDGPRYKSLGNSMATNVMAWIGVRLRDAMPERRS